MLYIIYCLFNTGSHLYLRVLCVKYKFSMRLNLQINILYGTRSISKFEIQIDYLTVLTDKSSEGPSPKKHHGPKQIERKVFYFS